MELTVVIASDQSFINQIITPHFVSKWVPLTVEALGEAEAIYKSQHIELKPILNTLTVYW
jgi:hypothetical protein